MISKEAIITQLSKKSDSDVMTESNFRKVVKLLLVNVMAVKISTLDFCNEIRLVPEKLWISLLTLNYHPKINWTTKFKHVFLSFINKENAKHLIIVKVTIDIKGTSNILSIP